MTMKELAKRWSIPDRSAERQQITLRIPFEDYAKLQALKEVYPHRSINDFLCDIIETGLEEIAAALPEYKLSYEDACEAAHFEGGKPEDYMDKMTGPKHFFENAYRRIMLRSSDESSKETEIKEAA